jgi:hypothetical protein
MRAIQEREPKRLKQAIGHVQLTEFIDVWPLVSVKPIKQRFCLANVGNLKALRECPVHRLKDLPCVGIPVLPDPETRKA